MAGFPKESILIDKMNNNKYFTIMLAVLLRSIWVIILLCSWVFAQEKSMKLEIVGSAYLENESYDLLQRLCDEIGGRLAGSSQNENAVKFLAEELEKRNGNVILEKFTMPGWQRGDDAVMIKTPISKKLHAVALGYVNAEPVFTNQLIFAKQGYPEDYESIAATGKIVLVVSEKIEDRPPLIRAEAIQIAAQQGAKAILFRNNDPGGLISAGTGDLQGNPTPIPALSITKEDGLWLERFWQKSLPINIEIKVNSHCKVIEAVNVVLRLPGKIDKKIVVGAHLDSWDLGQGSIDNGLGTAILFDVVRLMNTFSPQNYYTIEFVWFNGEELGLFGSKKYLEMHTAYDIITMINMDMTGSPTGFNTMGFEEFIPLLKELVIELNGFQLSKGVVSRPWLNSDHLPFMLAGIPVLTLTAHVDAEMLNSYHTRIDSFDKVNKKYLSEAAAVISLLVHRLANDQTFPYRGRNKKEIVDLLKKFNLDDRLKRHKEWPFGSD